MKKATTWVKYKVRCAYDAAHIFDKAFEIEGESEGVPSEVETFCPHCEKRVTVTIDGKAAPNASVLKTFKRFNAE